MEQKPKIFHIGGAHSVHLADLVKELDARGYPQCVLSYRKESLLPSYIPFYYNVYNKFYPNKSYPKDEAALRTLISDILQKEKPDIIHGHFLIFCCVALGIACELSHLPTFLSPWSTRMITKEKTLLHRIDKCIANSKYFLTDKLSFFKAVQQTYNVNLKDSMYVQFRLPLDLSAHQRIDIDKKDVTTPKILSARMMGEPYHQDLLMNALPSVFSKYPNATATFIVGHNTKQGTPYFTRMIALARDLGIHAKCTFIPEALTQAAFSKLLSEHNIVYSVCEDPGCAQTTIQAAYSGAVTIVRHNPMEDGILDHNVNVMKVHLKVSSIINSLLYSIEHLQELCKKFFVNNRKLGAFGTDHTLKTLTDLYDKEGLH